MDRLQALWMAGLIGVTLVAITMMMVGNWRLAAQGKLPRNPYRGVRTPSTQRTELAWVAGNRAAVRFAPLFLLLDAATCAALIAAALRGWRLVVVFVGSGGFVAFVALSIWTAVVASRAATAAE